MVSPRLGPATHCGVVALSVRSLERSLRYYTDRIGLRVQQQSAGEALLGAGTQALLRLVEQPGALSVQRNHTGLYHFALLTPDRIALGRLLAHLLETQTPIDGAGDHGVSEALYLTDPDGHGIELYRDRPRAEWPLVAGKLTMTTDPLDARGLLAAALPQRAWNGLEPETTVGHVHLHVADLVAAEHFYVELLGLDLMQRFGRQAVFVSAGGYHHHLGLNTWAGQGAPPAPAAAARLLCWELVVPAPADLQAALERLAAAGCSVTAAANSWQVSDPSANVVQLRVA